MTLRLLTFLLLLMIVTTNALLDEWEGDDWSEHEWERASLPGPACSPSPTPLFVLPGDTYTFNSPKNSRKKYPNNLNCSAQFSTVYGYQFKIFCKYIAIKPNDYLEMSDPSLPIIANVLIWYRVTDVKYKNVGIVTGLQNATLSFVTDEKGTAKGFKCKMSSVPQTEFQPQPPVDPDCTCGEINRPERIIGGDETGKNEYPWVVAIKISPLVNFDYCVGALISPDFVLTAAHCYLNNVQLDENTNITLVPYVSLGMHETNPFRYTSVRALEVIIHPDFNDGNLENDIAILRIPRVKLSHKVVPVCLPLDTSEDYAGYSATVTGWGLYSDGNFSDVLRQASVTVISNLMCASSNVTLPLVPITDEIMCTLREDSVTPCFGDGGGPLFVETTPGVAELVGILSISPGCFFVPEYSNIYTRVTEYLPWIQENTASSQFCVRPTDDY